MAGTIQGAFSLNPGTASGVVATFQASHAYKQGQLISQAGTVYYATANFTSGGSFNAVNWTPLPVTGRGAANGVAPLGADSLVPSSYLPAVTSAQPLVQDYASIPVGTTVLADTLVTNGGFLYSRKVDGTITGSFSATNWDAVFAGAALTGVGAPGTLAEGALYFSLDGSGFVTGLYLGTSTGPILVLDATGPILYGTFANRPTASSVTDGTVYITTDTGAMYQVRSSAWSSNLLVSGGGGSSFYMGAFGDGADGSLTFDGTTTVAGIAPSGGVYTMTRDLHATALTNNSGSTIKTAGYRIFCQGAMSNAGTISADGNNASGATAGAITTGLFVSQGGGAGGTTAGSAGATGLFGGGATAAGSGASGSGGGTTAPALALTQQIAARLLKIPNALLLGVFTFGANAATYIRGGSGGPGGGGDGTNPGGGGGAGGGVLAIFAASFTNTGTLSAKGGNGAAGTAGNSGGGSGGGGGVAGVYTRTAWTQSGTITVSGGTAGAGVGTGTNGAVGTTGQSFNVVLA